MVLLLTLFPASPDYELLYRDGNGSIVIHNVKSNRTKIIVSYKTFVSIQCPIRGVCLVFNDLMDGLSCCRINIWQDLTVYRAIGNT